MLRSLAASAVLAAVLLLPASADAGWSTPLALLRAPAGPGAVATDSAGDVAVAWATESDRPPSSENVSCSLHPFRRSCYPIVALHLTVRMAGGRVLSRTVWRERSGDMGMSLVIGRGEVTLGWGAYDIGRRSRDRPRGARPAARPMVAGADARTLL